MKLKCIGGPNDGEWHSTGKDYRVGDFVKILEKSKLISIQTIGSIHDTVTQYYIYIIDCFLFSKDDKYLFLRPNEWTNKQAILYQFNK